MAAFKVISADSQHRRAAGHLHVPDRAQIPRARASSLNYRDLIVLKGRGRGTTFGNVAPPSQAERCPPNRVNSTGDREFESSPSANVSFRRAHPGDGIEPRRLPLACRGQLTRYVSVQLQHSASTNLLSPFDRRLMDATSLPSIRHQS
jgi:hypothetical protein